MDKFTEFTGDSFDQNTGEFNFDKAHKLAIKSKDKVNVLICGLTGVGKSTLVNAIFGDEVVKAGIGEPVTQHLEKVEIPEKGLCLWDTKGIEAEDYKETLTQLKSDIKSQLKGKQYPHVGWVVINATSSRVQDADIKLIEILKDKGIPSVVVFTSVYGKQEREFVEAAKQIITERTKGHIKDAYVSVNSTPYEIDEDIVIPAKGLEELVEATAALFPKGHENAKNAFQIAQRANNEVRLLAMQKKAKTIVHAGALAAAAVGASPVPGSDAPLIAAAQSTMIYKINSEFELDMSSSMATATVAGILGITAVAQVGKAIVANALKFIPGVGTIAGAAISSSTAFALTEAVGHAYIATLSRYYNFKTGDVELPESTDALMSVFKSTFSYKP